MSITIGYSYDTPTQDAAALEATACEVTTGIRATTINGDIAPDIAISEAATQDAATRAAAQLLNTPSQRRLAAREANNDAAVARFLASRDAAARDPAAQDALSAREALVRETIARAVEARSTGARIGVFPPSFVPADGAPVAIVRNAGVPMLPPPGLAIHQARPPARNVAAARAMRRPTTPLADFPVLQRPTITAIHTRHSAAFMALDRPHHAPGSNVLRASTTSTAPDRSHRAAVSSAAGQNGVQTSTATGRRPLIPTARAAEANRQAQDVTAHRLAARDQRGRRAEARVLQADRNAVIDQAGDNETIRYLRGVWTLLHSLPMITY
jgi:hypothetical protein